MIGKIEGDGKRRGRSHRARRHHEFAPRDRHGARKYTTGRNPTRGVGNGDGGTGRRGEEGAYKPSPRLLVSASPSPPSSRALCPSWAGHRRCILGGGTDEHAHSRFASE